MYLDEVIPEHFKTGSELARTLGIRPSAVTNWRSRYNGLIPELQARRLADLKKGKVRFDPRAYE